MGYLLFSNLSMLRGSNDHKQLPDSTTNPVIPGTGDDVYAFDLEKKELTSIEVYPYDEWYSEPEATPPQGYVSRGVQHFALVPSSGGEGFPDLYYIGDYWYWGKASQQASAIYLAPGKNNTYPVNYHDLKTTIIKTFPVAGEPGPHLWECSSTIRVRLVSGGDGNPPRIYFSTARPDDNEQGCGQIYYLDDKNKPVPYYTVNFSDIPAAIDGISYWRGDFAFNDSGPVSENSTGTLYLSNGSYGSRIYQVPNAGLDSVSGTPQKLYTSTPTFDEDPSSIIQGMQYVKDAQGGEVLYFAAWDGIYKLDLKASQLTPEKIVHIDMEGAGNLLPSGCGLRDNESSFWDVGYADLPKPKELVIPVPAPVATPGRISRRQLYAMFPQLLGVPSPRPPWPEKPVVQAQEWVQQMLNTRTGRGGYALLLSQWSYNLSEGTSDRVSGYVRDQYGYWHMYDVRIAKDGKVQAHNSIVK